MIRRPPRTTRPDTCFHYPTLFRSLGPLLLGRYKGIFDKLYGEERSLAVRRDAWGFGLGLLGVLAYYRSEEHTSELQSLMRISYAVFCLQKKKHGIYGDITPHNI